jgi:hypothetical protein
MSRALKLHAHVMISEERQKILDEYAATSRTFCDSVERLRQSGADGEAFIRALAETGTARRACERLRVQLDKHLARGVAMAPHPERSNTERGASLDKDN